MKKIIWSILFFVTVFSTFAQFQRGMGMRNNRNMTRMPQQNQAPTESQKEAMLKKAEERKKEFIANFVSTLEADDFQKEIIKQSMDEYFVKVTDFAKVPFEHSSQRKDAFEALKKEHFAELKELISENDMTKINEMLDGKFEENEVKKKKRKKRKKRRKKNDDDINDYEDNDN